MSSTSSAATDPVATFGRQALRTLLVPEWFAASGIAEGGTVADLGCGSGYLALRAAERVGPAGRVYAVDQDPECIDLLGRTAALHQLDQVHTVVDDIHGLAAFATPVEVAFLTMVLHHVPSPADLLRHLRHTIPDDAYLLVAEFAPDGPGLSGPGLSARAGPAHVGEWAALAGFDMDRVERQTTEHWFCVLRPR